MIEERALVLFENQDANNLQNNVRVKVQRTSACESCSLKSGCGQSTLTKMSGEHCLELDVANTLNAKPGDEVLIAIPESGLMSASIRVYFLPLLLMLVGAMVGDFIEPETEIWTSILGLAGLIGGFYWARLYSQGQADNVQFQPSMAHVFIPSHEFQPNHQEK
ncbi:MAG: SoxR reducing system RseC family protein [Methylotenera sp.]